MSNTSQQVTWDELQRQAVTRLWRGTKSEVTASVNTRSAVDFFGASNVVQDLSVKQLDEYIANLEQKGNTNATINRKLSSLSKMLKFALDREYITKIPKIDKKKESNGRIRWLTDEEEKNLIGYFNETHRKDLCNLIVFLLETGARVGEALSVNWKDVDRNVVSFWDTKNNTPRSVPITRKVAIALASQNGAQTETEETQKRDGPFSHIDYSEFHYLWQKAKNSLGFKDDDQFVPHCLRHTCASRLAQAGVPLITIKEFMGHKSIQVTMRYAHLAPNQLEKAREALENR